MARITVDGSRMLSLPRRERKTRETPIANRIRIALNRIEGVWVAKNFVGLVWTVSGDRVRAGLGVGTPDIVGTITIGEPSLPIAVAFGLEVKTPHGRGKHPEIQAAQKGWRALARKRGLLAELVTSEAEAIAAVERFRDEYTRRIMGLVTRAPL